MKKSVKKPATKKPAATKKKSTAGKKATEPTSQLGWAAKEGWRLEVLDLSIFPPGT